MLDLKFAFVMDQALCDLQIQKSTLETNTFLVSLSIPKFVGARLKLLRTSELGH